MKYIQSLAAIAALSTTLCGQHALASVEYGAKDSRTGASWIQASTPEEGVALGYRMASTSEFASYLSSGGYFADYPNAPQAFHALSGSLMGFGSDTWVYSTSLTGGSYPPSTHDRFAVVMGRLAGDGDQAGALLRSEVTVSMMCPGPVPYQCGGATSYLYGATYGGLAELSAGTLAEGYTKGINKVWSGALTNLKQEDGSYTLGYFMTNAAAVPEPSSWMLMGLGLLAISAAGRARLKANPKPTWA
jgi:PEP-CTERM motif